MLDLDETLCSNLFTKEGIETYVRPYAEKFLRGTKKLFDSRYLCTSIGKETAFEILNNNFFADLIDDFEYWHWKRYSIKSKGAGYGQFKDSAIVHVEDRMIPGDFLYDPNIMKEEDQDFKQHGVLFLPVIEYTPKSIIDGKVIMPEQDRELNRVLGLIKRNLERLKAQRKP